MSLEDVSVVFHLGEQVFTAAKSQSHYRSWDQFTVVDFFNGDPQYSLVAEVEKKKVVGFCLGTTIQKSGDMGKYGYVTWLGVKEKLRRRGIGTHLYEDILKRMITANVKILLVDTEEGNTAALNFFAKHGFDAPTKHVYLDLNVKSLAEAQST